MDPYRKNEVIDAFEIARAITKHGILTKIGDLNITSGSLIVGDIIHEITESNKLVQKFPIGTFPVYYYRFNNAGTLIMFDDTKTPNKWELANYFTKKRKVVQKFLVETAHFVYMDKDGLDTIAKNELENLYPEGFVLDEISQRFKNNKDTLHFDIPIANCQNNLILIHTEWGDDSYSSYIGLDKEGIPVCLYTDLGDAKF